MGKKGKRKPGSNNVPEIEMESRGLSLYDVKRKLQLTQRAIQKKDHKKMFSSPITDAIAPGYSQIIAKPMDFYTINKKINSESYSTFREYMTDVSLVLQNCMTYNMGETPYFKYAAKLAPQFEKIFSKELGVNYTIKLPPPRTEPILLRDIIPGYESSEDDQDGDEEEGSEFQNSEPPSVAVDNNSSEVGVDESLIPELETPNSLDSTSYTETEMHIENKDEPSSKTPIYENDTNIEVQPEYAESSFETTVEMSERSDVQSNCVKNCEISSQLEKIESKVSTEEDVGREKIVSGNKVSESRADLNLPLEVDVEQNFDRISLSSDVSKTSGFSFASSNLQPPSTPTKQRKPVKKKKRNDMFEFVDEEIPQKPVTDIPGKSKLSIEDILNMSSETGGDGDDTALNSESLTVAEKPCSPIEFSDEESNINTTEACRISADLADQNDCESMETGGKDTEVLSAIANEHIRPVVDKEESISSATIDKSSNLGLANVGHSNDTQQLPPKTGFTESQTADMESSEALACVISETKPAASDPSSEEKVSSNEDCVLPSSSKVMESASCEISNTEQPLKRKRGRPKRDRSKTSPLKSSHSRRLVEENKAEATQLQSVETNFCLPDAIDADPLLLGHSPDDLPGCSRKNEKPAKAKTIVQLSMSSDHVQLDQVDCNAPGVIISEHDSFNDLSANLLPKFVPNSNYASPPSQSRHEKMLPPCSQILSSDSHCLVSPKKDCANFVPLEGSIANISPSILSFTPSAAAITGINFGISPTKYFDDLLCFDTPVKGPTELCSSLGELVHSVQQPAPFNQEFASIQQFQGEVVGKRIKRAQCSPNDAPAKKVAKVVSVPQHELESAEERAKRIESIRAILEVKAPKTTPLAGSVQNPLGYLRNGGFKGQVSYVPTTPCSEKRINFPKDYLTAKDVPEKGKESKTPQGKHAFERYAYLSFGHYGHNTPSDLSNEKSDPNQQDRLQLELLHSVYSGPLGLQFAESLKKFTSNMNPYMKSVVDEFLNSFTDGKHFLHQTNRLLSLPFTDDQKFTLSSKDLKALKGLKRQGIDVSFLDDNATPSGEFTTKADIALCVDSVLNIASGDEKSNVSAEKVMSECSKSSAPIEVIGLNMKTSDFGEISSVCAQFPAECPNFKDEGSVIDQQTISADVENQDYCEDITNENSLDATNLMCFEDCVDGGNSLPIPTVPVPNSSQSGNSDLVSTNETEVSGSRENTDVETTHHHHLNGGTVFESSERSLESSAECKADSQSIDDRISQSGDENRSKFQLIYESNSNEVEQELNSDPHVTDVNNLDGHLNKDERIFKEQCNEKVTPNEEETNYPTNDSSLLQVHNDGLMSQPCYSHQVVAGMESADAGTVPTSVSITCDVSASSELTISVPSTDSFCSLFQPSTCNSFSDPNLLSSTAMSPFFDAFGHIEVMTSESKTDGVLSLNKATNSNTYVSFPETQFAPKRVEEEKGLFEPSPNKTSCTSSDFSFSNGISSDSFPDFPSSETNCDPISAPNLKETS